MPVTSSVTSSSDQTLLLPKASNQARGLARYALEFLRRPGGVGRRTLERVEQFHLDSVGCGVSSLALFANAPTVLRREAMAMHGTSVPL